MNEWICSKRTERDILLVCESHSHTPLSIHSIERNEIDRLTRTLMDRNDVLQTLQASLSTTSPMIDRLRSRDDFALDLEGISGSTTTGHTVGGGSSAGAMRMHGEEPLGEGEGESSGKVLARLMDWLEARQVGLIWSRSAVSLQRVGWLIRGVCIGSFRDTGGYQIGDGRRKGKGRGRV
jgi:hypothetical protein